MAVPLGVAFDGFIPTGEAIDLARKAVDAGAKSLWMAEHLGYREATLTCMAFALSTERAMLVPTAVSPYLWHPTPTAMAMATLAEAAPGRAALAVGVGNPLFLQESGKEMAKPVRAVREFVECLRELWSGEAVHYEGEMFRLAGARMGFRPSSSIPIYIAAMGADMLRLSGRMADGVVLSAGLSVGFARHSLSIAAEGARQAGRDPAQVRKAGYLHFAVSEDGKVAMELLREKLAFLLRNKFLAQNIAFTGIPIDQEAIIDAVARRDMAAASRLVPDEAVEAFTVGGTPRQCRERLQAYMDAGLEEPVLSILGRAQDKILALGILRELSAPSVR